MKREFTRRAEAVERAALVDLHRAASLDLSDRLGLELSEAGGALVSIARCHPTILVNRVVGLGMDRPADRATVEDIVKRYRDAGIERYFLQLDPSAAPDELPGLLEQAGLESYHRAWAKFNPGNYIVVTFSPAIPNIVGPDFVLFEGHFDIGTYVVSTDYDAFSATLAVGPGADSGESRSYYYDGAGPYDADIFGMEFDLSNLGVPADATVSSVRFEASNDMCDPIGIGALSEPIPVELMTFTVE